MSLNLNTVHLAGHLTRDPQLKSLPNDRTVVSFSLAINRRFKGPDGEMKEEATFVDCEAWNRTAELVGQYLTKGSGCYIEGRLKLDQWDDKEGKKQSRLKVVAESVQFLSNKPRADGEAPAETHNTTGNMKHNGVNNSVVNNKNGTDTNPSSTTPARQTGKRQSTGVAATVDEPPF